MTPTNAGFKSRQAPCGRIVDGESDQDRDEYACGCRSNRHECHDGTVLMDELLSAE